jgi:mRNA interferase MazF
VSEEEAPDRGDLVDLSLDLGDRAGHEQAGWRPALVLSSRRFNAATGMAVVCPLTSTTRGWAFEVPLPEGLDATGVILCDQVRSVDWQHRRWRRRGALPAAIVQRVADVVHAILEP